LAKKVGLSAFCFYFYWFGGKTLLEAPIRSFVENKNIDFQFCLCWANDDWSRAWSGNTDDILISQQYSPEDDYAFISHLSYFLRSDKYLRVDGKPLINIWRSALLPDPAGTVQRWREWCLRNGIGEIHVSRSENYERLDPAEHGLDSSLQHSPGDTRWIEPNIARYRDAPILLNPKFNGQMFDYNDLVRRACEFKRPNYRLFRSVCPSWDNQARRPGGGRVLMGANPSSYRNYLETVIEQTVQVEPVAGERLVFINAWNEWGEGAHLEPDRRYGFGNLEATKMANLRVALKHNSIPEPDRLAIIAHVYYVDLLEECLGWIRDTSISHDLFVTTLACNQPIVEEFLVKHRICATVRTTENRGRDVAPFLEVLKSLDYTHYGRVLKLHTKLNSLWRQGLYRALTDERFLMSGYGLFKSHPEIGILGPSEYLLSTQVYLGDNEVAMRKLADRMGITTIDWEADTFFAGTMFLARTKALLPLGALGFVAEDFEPEQGQRDGTLAHSVERSIIYSAKAAGLRIAAMDDNYISGNPGLVSRGRTTFDHAKIAPRVDATKTPA